MRLLAAILPVLLVPFLSGQRVNLYLRNGGDLLVKDYRVIQDRVEYYSVERGVWEEIPLSYIDLKKTQREQNRKQAAREARAHEDKIERMARQKARTELHRVPLEDGVYYLHHDAVKPLQQAEVFVVVNKKARLLQLLAPIFLGKSTLEINGTHSPFSTQSDQPMFYVRLEKIERLMIVRLTEKNEKTRIVQHILKAPKSIEAFEEQEEVEIFRQQLAPQVYKIWPVGPIASGNYALIEFTRGEGDTRVWDFMIKSKLELGQPVAQGCQLGENRQAPE